jgi:hypothetical protein
MKNGSESLKGLCSDLGLKYQSLIGKRATKENVQNLIQMPSWLKLSCHGKVDIELGKFAFVLSDGSQDPPALGDLLYREDLASRYLYQWDEISGVEGGSCRLIFSTACSTGSSSTTYGGEQLGMARSFFRSNALSYVGPLWPVGGRGAQEFINTLIQYCLSKPEIPLMNHIADVRKALSGKVPPYINYAFVLHGYFGPLVDKKDLSKI